MIEKAEKHIRIKVIGVFRNENRLLAVRVVDPATGGIIYVPPGGGVEFGEDSVTAFRREMQEELGTAVVQTALLGVLENRFTFAGNSGHEIVFVYHAEFLDSSRYERDLFVINESDGTRFEAGWINFTAAGPDAPSIRPEGLTALLKNSP